MTDPEPTTHEAVARLSSATRALGLAVVAPVWPAARQRLGELVADEEFVAKAMAVGLGEDWARSTLTHCTAVADYQGFSFGARRRLIDRMFVVAMRDLLTGEP